MIPYYKNMPEDKLIRQFKWACIAEGITCILLYAIAMPMKYQWGIWQQMPAIGSLHGIAFLWYMAMLYYVRTPLKWDDEDLFIAGLAGFFPFLTFWVEKKLIPQEIPTEEIER